VPEPGDTCVVNWAGAWGPAPWVDLQMAWLLQGFATCWCFASSAVRSS
jgi:hypothetical protein